MYERDSCNHAFINGDNAINVLGQTNFNSNGTLSPPNKNSLDMPTNILYFNDYLFVVDASNNRIISLELHD
ncbi:hypothetical protein N9N67_08770 [Bacteriovoracaceae bacterium]|nr:hypothetical protein [Bacteriovoracaceae bacterium]